MGEYPTTPTRSPPRSTANGWPTRYPELNGEIAQRIKEGRWELVGGMWLEPDLNMPDGESLVRQILVGQDTFKKLYGVTTRIGWNPDSFGYNWQLPQVYKRSGIDYFVTQKMTWNDTNQLPLKLFWWQSPDGSKVLTYFPHDYSNNNLDQVRLAKDMAVARDRAPGLTDMLDLYGVGDHGGGPTRQMLDQGLHWQEAGKVVPKQEFRTAQPYFTKVEGELNPDSPTWNYASIAKGDTKLPTPAAGQISVPTWKDELYLEYHRGVFTTQAAHKRNMRDSEEWVLNAEKYASLAWLDGQHYPATEITDAWKHDHSSTSFHDLAAGSGIAVIYQATPQKDFDRSLHWAADQEISSRTPFKTLAAQCRYPAPRMRRPPPRLQSRSPGQRCRAPSSSPSSCPPINRGQRPSSSTPRNKPVPSPRSSRTYAATHTFTVLAHRVRRHPRPPWAITVLHAERHRQI